MSTKATGNKNTLPLLIVLPLNMVHQPWGKFHADLPAESTKGFFYHFPRRFGVTFSGSHFQNETQRKRSECEHFFRTV